MEVSLAAASSNDGSIRREGGLANGTVRIDGLPGAITDVLARVEREDGTTQVARLRPEQPAFVVEPPAHATGVAWTYLGLGVHHILVGIDHLLYILAMLFLVKGWRRIVADDVGLYGDAQPDADRGGARLGPRATASCRGLHRVEYRLRGARNRPSPPRSPRTHGSLALGGLVHASA